MKAMLMSLLAEQCGPEVTRSPRTLDFGCGAGNVIRHFAREARSGEVWGADIDAASIAWLEHNLGEPFRFRALSTTPALPLPADHFDLVYAISVFTHLADDWAGWLVASVGCRDPAHPRLRRGAQTSEHVRALPIDCVGGGRTSRGGRTSAQHRAAPR
jgi:SAM-dependent methyltransferase